MRAGTYSLGMKTTHSDHAGQDENTKMLRRELSAQLSLRGFEPHDEDPANRMYRTRDHAMVTLTGRAVAEGTCRIDREWGVPGQKMTYEEALTLVTGWPLEAVQGTIIV